MHRESSIEHPCCALLTQYGWEVVKVGHTGYPDRIAIKRRFCVWLEFKTADGRLTAAQKRRIPKLEKKGQIVVVIDSVDKLRNYLDHNYYPFSSF